MTRIDALVEENRTAKARLHQRASELRFWASRIEACTRTGEVPPTLAMEAKATALSEAVRIWAATEVALVNAQLDGLT